MCVGDTSSGELVPRRLFPMQRVLSAFTSAAVHRRRSLATSLHQRLRQVRYDIRLLKHSTKRIFGTKI